VAFVEDDEVRGRSLAPPMQRRQATDLHGGVRVRWAVGLDDAVRDACRREPLGRVVDQRIQVRREDDAPALGHARLDDARGRRRLAASRAELHQDGPGASAVLGAHAIGEGELVRAQGKAHEAPDP
jgi:hypothetical protein